MSLNKLSTSIMYYHWEQYSHYSLDITSEVLKYSDYTTMRDYLKSNSLHYLLEQT